MNFFFSNAFVLKKKFYDAIMERNSIIVKYRIQLLKYKIKNLIKVTMKNK